MAGGQLAGNDDARRDTHANAEPGERLKGLQGYKGYKVKNGYLVTM